MALPRPIMALVYRSVLLLAAAGWAALAAFAEYRLHPVGDWVVYVGAAATLVAAAQRPTYRLRKWAVVGSVLAGLWRATLLVGLQLAGENGPPAVGAFAWMFVATVGAAMSAYGWVQEGPG